MYLEHQGIVMRRLTNSGFFQNSSVIPFEEFLLEPLKTFSGGVKGCPQTPILTRYDWKTRTHLVDFHGKLVGKSTSPMNPSWVPFIINLDIVVFFLKYFRSCIEPFPTAAADA